MRPGLLTPLQIRDLTLVNRSVVSAMCLYSAGTNGVARTFHEAHLTRFALGGAGLIFTEATAISADGRITPADLGIYTDEQAGRLGEIAGKIKELGSVPGIQISHAGRKGSGIAPWAAPEDYAQTEGFPWDIKAPSAIAAPRKATPEALSAPEIDQLLQDWIAAARRADAAGFEVLELHGAHGYLLHQFLSPLTNQRRDNWGGSLENRMRFPLEVVRAVRAVWPAGKALFYRMSVGDGDNAHWSIADSITFAHRLKELGVDVVDCSGGGIEDATMRRPPGTYGYQVPWAARLKHDTGVRTMAVGLITDAHQADSIIAEGQADLVALARQNLVNPNWTALARHQLTGGHDGFPPQFASFLARWSNVVSALPPVADAAVHLRQLKE